MLLNGINHVATLTGDTDRFHAFYREVFEADVLADMKEAPEGEGVRLSFVDLRDARRPRYHHVLLVEPVRGDDGSIRADPVSIHAGGIGWE